MNVFTKEKVYDKRPRKQLISEWICTQLINISRVVLLEMNNKYKQTSEITILLLAYKNVHVVQIMDIWEFLNEYCNEKSETFPQF